MDDRRSTGSTGEDLAVELLRNKGYQVLDRNWRSGRRGELDIVAVDPEPSPEGTLVFCEVKCRRGLGYGDPFEAITYAKLRRLHDLGWDWMRSHDRWSPRHRVDGVGVLLLPGEPPLLDHRTGLGL